VIDHPFNPALVALGAEGTFVARSMDRDPKHLREMLLRMHQHKGTSFIDVMQNCVIFNDGAFDLYTVKETKSANTVFLEHGKPLVFGKDDEMGIRLDGFRPEVVSLNDYSVNDLLVHDEKSKELAFILAEMSEQPGFPSVLGVFLDIERSVYEDELSEHIDASVAKSKSLSLDDLLREGQTWEIPGV